MIITGMAHFESVCKKKLVDWYHKNKPGVEIDLSNVFVVWACKTLQNYKCLASTTISGDGIYAEYTYNGDKQELYEDVYTVNLLTPALLRNKEDMEMGFTEILTIIFIVLKLLGVITWAWWVCLLPEIIAGVLYVIVVVAQLVAIYKTHKSIKKHFDEF